MCILPKIPCVKFCESKNDKHKCSYLERDKMSATNLKLTKRGLEWLQIDIANTFGLDKEFFEDRIKWVLENDEFLEALEDEAESPQQYKNAVKALRDHQGDRDVHHYMYLDCSNQALQIYAVVTGCLDTAKICNLGGFDGKMNDAYSEIAVELNKIFESKCFKRYNCKKPLMTTLYGKRKAGSVISSQMELEDFDEYTKLGIDEDSIVPAFQETMEKLAPRAMNAMAKIQDLNSEYIGQYFWELPDGFKVKYDVKSKVSFEGKRTSARGVSFSYSHETEVYRPSKFNAGMAPNVIHSIDGYIARELIRRMGDKFITSIHDAYAVHPNDVDIMISNYKDIMIELLESNILDDIMSQIANSRAYFKVEKVNTLTKEHILNSVYALA